MPGRLVGARCRAERAVVGEEMMTRDFLRSLARATPARALMRQRYERRFRTSDGAGALSGVYASFAEAAAAAPDGVPRGYDTSAAAGLYRDLLDCLQAKDYPALFWMREAIADATTVVDLGGHVGIAYYAFRDYLTLPATLRWVVCDTPAVVDEGAALAVARGETQLRFTADRGVIDDADVLLAAGVLQYLPESLDVLLGTARPRHIVVNQTPTHPEREFVTLQNIGVAFCPYRVTAVDGLAERLAPLGYTLVDRWEDPARRTAVPYHAEAGPVAYTGYYFRR